MPRDNFHPPAVNHEIIASEADRKIAQEVRARVTDLLKDCTPALQIIPLLEIQFPQVPFKELEEHYLAVLDVYSRTDEQIEKEKPKSLGQQILLAQVLYAKAVEKNSLKVALDTLKYMGALRGLEGKEESPAMHTVNILNNIPKQIENLSDEQLKQLDVLPAITQQEDPEEVPTDVSE